ncbi:MAG TPA: hypothetical protein PLI95_20625 [Polyangiaceae bacterium]|nr:hypothetical protein [Polyangiaceae bacterium]
MIGWAQGTCDLGGFHLEAPREAGFLAWFDPDGAVAGARSFTADQPIHASIAAAPGGDGIVAGHFVRTLDLGAGAMQARGETDAFLARLDARGALRWQRQFSGADKQQIFDVAVAPAGEIAIVGTYRDGALDLGTGPMPDRGRTDIFVASFTLDGAPRWARSYGDDNERWATSIAVDAAGCIAIGGSVESPLDLGDGVVARDARSSSIGWVAKLDSKGRALWARAFASIRHPHRIHDLAMGPDGGVAGQIALGDATLTGSAFFSDVVVARSGEILVHGSHVVTTDEGNALHRDLATYFQTFDSQGAARSTRVVRDIDEAAVGHAIALDSRGRLITVGAFKGTLDFGMGAMTTRPGRHEYAMFLAALMP